MTKYEIMFILSTQQTEEEKASLVKKVEEILSKAGATELSTEIMGERKLAYQLIRRKWILCIN